MPNSSLPLVLRQALLCTLIPISIFSSAQKLSPPTVENDWHVLELNEPAGNYYTTSSYYRSILYLETGEMVTAIQYNKEEWGAAKINAAGKTIWTTSVNGPVRGISKSGENFLLFFGGEEDARKNFTEITDLKMSTKISAALINGKTGKQIKTKVLYDNGRPVYMDSRAMNHLDGSFAYLMVRISNLKKISFFSQTDFQDRLETDKIMLFTFGPDLDAVNTNVKAIGQKGLFMGAEVGKNDDLFFFSYTDDQLLVERFNKNGTAVDKLTTPFEARTKNDLIRSVTSIDPMDPERVFIGLKYNKKGKDSPTQAFEFNFGVKKISGSGEIEFDKSYRKTMEVKEIKKLQGGDYNSPSVITNIIPTKSRIVVIKEVQFIWTTGTNNTTMRYRNDGIIIDIYDRDWKLQKTIALDKKYEIFYPVGRTFGVKAINDNLYIVATAIDGPLKYATVYAVIDLPKAEVETFTTLDRDEIRNARPVEGGASLWLPDGVLIEYLVEKGGFIKGKKSHASFWQKITF
jgi:hypothetical protein